MAPRLASRTPLVIVSRGLRPSFLCTSTLSCLVRWSRTGFVLVLESIVADDRTNKQRGITAMGRVWCVLLAAAWLALGVVPCSAQNYPTRPVRLVVGFPAGGPTDAIARIVAQKLSDKLGQQFFVENIGGGGGNTPAGPAARAAPAGYTIYAISTGVA